MVRKTEPTLVTRDELINLIRISDQCTVFL